MGRAPCCDKNNVKRGPWSPEEDAALKNYVERYGTGGNWISLPQKAGLKRCGKSCRLRWLNYLRPDIKHGGFTEEEDNVILTLFSSIGSRWSVIASNLPGRTDNDVKNYWNTKLKKKMLAAQANLTAASTTYNPPPPPPSVKIENYSHGSCYTMLTDTGFGVGADHSALPSIIPGFIQPNMPGYVVSPASVHDASAASSTITFDTSYVPWADGAAGAGHVGGEDGLMMDDVVFGSSSSELFSWCGLIQDKTDEAAAAPYFWSDDIAPGNSSLWVGGSECKPQDVYRGMTYS